MKSIVLNRFAESLAIGFADDEKIQVPVATFCCGTHGCCHAPVDMVRISETHIAFSCRNCGRIPESEMPISEISTFGSMGNWYANQVRAWHNHEKQVALAILQMMRF